MPVKVVQIPQVGDVLLKKNIRSTRIRLYVKPNQQVIVSIPAEASFKAAEDFALKHTEWILKQLEKHNHALSEYDLNSVYYTKFHVVKISEKDCEKPVARISGNSVQVSLPAGTSISAGAVQEFISKVVTEVYRKEAKTYLPQRTMELAQQFGFKFNEVSVRNNHSNWGSCSSKNNISLNINLMKLPDHLIDYIILHELSHTLVKNHGKEFYWVLDRVTGNRARELAKEIKKFSTYS